MEPVSLLKRGRYTPEWIKEFYDQASGWWGPDPQAQGVHQARLATIERLCGAGKKRILDLGCGSGHSSAAAAAAGHAVVAVELSPARAAEARRLAAQSYAGSLIAFEADFFTVQLDSRFDVVCCWEVFGLGSDADQRRLLRRMANEWLAPGGSVLMDVYNPARYAHDANTEERLAPLKGVPGSVEMIERCHFDPVHSRWIDEWQPAANPEKSLAQAVRCYTPADLLLLLEGTGLALQRVEVDGKAIDFASHAIQAASPLLTAWSFLAQLKLEK